MKLLVIGTARNLFQPIDFDADALTLVLIHPCDVYDRGGDCDDRDDCDDCDDHDCDYDCIFCRFHEHECALAPSPMPFLLPSTDPLCLHLLKCEAKTRPHFLGPSQQKSTSILMPFIF